VVPIKLVYAIPQQKRQKINTAVELDGFASFSNFQTGSPVYSPQYLKKLSPKI